MTDCNLLKRYLQNAIDRLIFVPDEFHYPPAPQEDDLLSQAPTTLVTLQAHTQMLCSFPEMPLFLLH